MGYKNKLTLDINNIPGKSLNYKTPPEKFMNLGYSFRVNLTIKNLSHSNSAFRKIKGSCIKCMKYLLFELYYEIISFCDSCI